MRSREARGALSHLMPIGDEALQAMGAQTLYQLLHRHAHPHVYQVTDALNERLEATELKGLYTGDIRLPFPSIQIFAPKSISLQVYNEQSKFHRFHSVYVTEAMAPKGREWRILSVGVAKGRCPTGDPDDAIHFFNLPLPEGMTLDDAIVAENEVLEDYLRYACLSDENLKAWRNEWRRIFRWVLNVVMYATSSDVRSLFSPEVEEVRRTLKRRKKGEKRTRAQAQWRQLGNRIILGHDLEPIPRDRSRKQQLISGHFKNQACGVRWQDHKRIFIEPHYRNVDADEVSTTTQTRL